MPGKAEILAQAVRHLHGVDPILGAHIKRAGPFTLKLHRNRFDLLTRSILSQQISTTAARSIRKRLTALAEPEGVTPEFLLTSTDDHLRSAGVSPQKIRYLKDLSAKVIDGTLKLNRLGRLNDEDIISELTQVKGIGRWTAQMFLIFSMGRWDVFPPDDLGIRVAIRDLYQLPETPSPKACAERASPWRPWSTIATWYLWRFADQKADPNASATEYPV